jgi:penicillin-binding protein 2
MKTEHPNIRKRRARLAAVVIAVLMGVLALSFFRVQVMRGTAWALQSDSNRLRVLQVPAPRGTIFDRYGRVIADNIPSYSVSLFPAPLDSIRATLNRLQPILGIDDQRVEELIEQASLDRRMPLQVLRDAEYPVVAALEERRGDFPDVFMEVRPKRRYMGGTALGHILGYVGEISREELDNPRFEGYEQRMIVGKDGLERQYEGSLQGDQGVRYVEVDAVGRVVGSFEGYAAAEALPGEDLYLHIDLELMEFIDEIFPEGGRGAVVMLNVEDGGILALYSAPSFDPNHFVGGIERGLWDALNQDPSRPLFNRAVIGRYPPASTWKLASGAIGLELGVVDPHAFMPVPCTGTFRYGNDVRACWNNAGHGYLDMAGAIAHSCNVYFYQLGLRVGLETLVHEGSRLGFGELCGVDLPAESRGVFPAGLDFWRERYGWPPTENEVLSLVIGQGPNDQTPLKMAQFYLAIGRDGSAPAPQLARPGPGENPDISWRLDLGNESLEALREGLRQVTAVGGTAFNSSLEHWDLIGKTGTAQQGTGLLPHAWFVGLAGPWDTSPEIAVAVIIEEGESGSRAAAPIAAKAADFHLRQKYGVPVDTIQTLGEHLNAGVPAPWARWTID